jgi:hypothetical protein
VRRNAIPHTFTIDTLSHVSLTYEPTANTDPDGDSDGTTIKLWNAIRQAWLDWLRNRFKEGSG